MTQALLFPDEEFVPNLYDRNDFLLLPGWPSMNNPLNLASVLRLNPDDSRYECLGRLSKDNPSMYEKVLALLKAHGVKTEP